MNYLVLAIAALILAGLSYLGYILIVNKEKLTDDDDQCQWPQTIYEPPPPGSHYVDSGRSMPDEYRTQGTLQPNNDSDVKGETWYTWDPWGTEGTKIEGPLTCDNITKSPCTWDGGEQCLKLGNRIIDANQKVISQMYT